MSNLELFKKATEALSLDKYNISASNLENGKIKMGSMDIGDIRSTNGIIIFNVGSENFRVMEISDGFQVFANNIDYFLHYTCMSNFIEINYFDNDRNRLTLTEQNDTIELRYVFPVKETDEYIKSKGAERYAKHDRRLTLVSNDNGVFYRYSEFYHTEGNSSAMVWEYKIDNINNKFNNYWDKGEDIHNEPLNCDLERAIQLISENLKTTETLSDINAIKVISETAFMADMNKKLEQILSINRYKK